MKQGTRNCSPVQRLARMASHTVFLLFLALSSCSTVKVRKDKNAVTREGIESAVDLQTVQAEEALNILGKSCEELLKEGRRLERRGRDSDAAGFYLNSAVQARELIVAGNFGPNERSEASLINLHNRSLARLAEIWSEDPRHLDDRPVLYGSASEKFELVLDPDSDFPRRYFDRAVSTASIRGKGVVDKRREGYGASLVAIRDTTEERAEEMEFFPKKGLHIPVTIAVSGVRQIDADTKEVSISILDSTRNETVQVGARSYPLAADFSAPMEMLLTGRNEVIQGLTGFLNARKQADMAGIYLLEPYDPGRIPVILTHGLISVPIIWRDIIPEIISEPELAKRYQIFAFTYPSSYPIGESALLFRNELEELREKYDPERDDPLSTDIVAMGHSMGGVLTHLLAKNMGDHLWNEISDQPFDEIVMTEEQRKSFGSVAFFEPDPAANRLVFFSAPHGGAEMATLSIVNSVSRLAKLPGNLLISTASLTSGPPIPGLKVDIKKKVTSVQSLQPSSPIVLAMKKAPFKSGVTYHSVIGDRGLGDTPESSDGVVEYWSSHLDGAASELIVPTDHGTYKDPGAIKELKRILRVHAGLRSR